MPSLTAHIYSDFDFECKNASITTRSECGKQNVPGMSLEYNSVSFITRYQLSVRAQTITKLLNFANIGIDRGNALPATRNLS